MEIITTSATETKKFASEFAKRLRLGDLLCLYGDLGSGKTTFVQGLAEGLDFKKRVLSPTFVFVRIYPLGSRKLKLIHIDLYRVEKIEDADSLGLEDFWSDPKNIVVIEWAERVKDLLPKKRVNVTFEYVDGDRRRIEVSNLSSRS